jgi:hypothetical protein
VARNGKRWPGGDHRARWTAAGLLEAEKKFRKGKGYRELKELAAKLSAWHEWLNPHSTPQPQVAYSADRREPPVSTKSGTCSADVQSDIDSEPNQANYVTNSLATRARKIQKITAASAKIFKRTPFPLNRLTDAHARATRHPTIKV